MTEPNQDKWGVLFLCPYQEGSPPILVVPWAGHYTEPTPMRVWGRKLLADDQPGPRGDGWYSINDLHGRGCLCPEEWK